MSYTLVVTLTKYQLSLLAKSLSDSIFQCSRDFSFPYKRTLLCTSAEIYGPWSTTGSSVAGCTGYQRIFPTTIFNVQGTFRVNTVEGTSNYSGLLCYPKAPNQALSDISTMVTTTYRIFDAIWLPNTVTSTQVNNWLSSVSADIRKLYNPSNWLFNKQYKIPFIPQVEIDPVYLNDLSENVTPFYLPK